ncbi:large ribosomal subunit protein bL32m [Parasteatoda tepidariorum]|uniref:large ribosomal subunit protein bL32m n=1 Tax=Parasteatoda tepidariorum TaxID=114398 RepID=UPI00077FA68D|nr:39S ribosomal protein L32, mitochondrial [Parasteatoda tepidariorum]
MNSILRITRNIRMCIIRISEAIRYQDPFSPELSIAGNFNLPSVLPENKTQSTLRDILQDGFLWAVPKHRRSLERRMTRRMGLGKPIIPKNNLIVCEACGHFHPVHTICGNCYSKVREETEYLQNAVINELKLDPIEQEVKLVYENDSKNERTFEGKRIIELPKERPQWFCNNLLMKDSEIPRKKTTSINETVITPKIEDV